MSRHGRAEAGTPSRRLEPAAMAGLGALQTLALTHTWAWPLPWLAAAVLVARLDRASPGRAATLGMAFGTGWLGAAVWWLFISMHRYGGLPAPLAALAVLALALALSTYLALAGALYARLRRGQPLADATVFASLWLLAELARGVLFTGFPWGAAGYTQVDAPLAALAPWVGVYGVGAVLAFGAAWLAGTLAPVPRPQSPAATAPVRRARAALLGAAPVACVLLALQLLPVASFTRDAGSLDVRLLQTDVAQDQKFRIESLPQVLDWTADALTAGRAALAIGPETVIPLLPAQLEPLAPGYWPALQQRLQALGRAALVGVPLGDATQGYTNSVIGLPGEPAYRYDKVHLVPFGEFVPTGFRWFTELMDIPLGDFARGSPDAASFAVQGQRVAPNICYEDLFGEELARRFRDPARAPTMLANVSNIAWFGDTVAVPQHLNISRMRTLELQRPMLRATNTGATAVIDHTGHVQALLPPFTRGTLEARAQGRDGLTPFARWAGRWGLAPLAAAALALLGMAAWRARARGGAA